MIPKPWLAFGKDHAPGNSTMKQAPRVAGASQVGAATQRDWGGYSGYFADPDGFRWEVACNPGEIGQSVLP